MPSDSLIKQSLSKIIPAVFKVMPANIMQHLRHIVGTLHEINQMVNLIANHLVKRRRVAGDANPRLKLT